MLGLDEFTGHNMFMSSGTTRSPEPAPLSDLKGILNPKHMGSFRVVISGQRFRGDVHCLGLRVNLLPLILSPGLYRGLGFMFRGSGVQGFRV